MIELDKNLNGGIFHLKPFRDIRGKADGSLYHINFKEDQYDVVALHVGINDLLKSRTKSHKFV